MSVLVARVQTGEHLLDLLDFYCILVCLHVARQLVLLAKVQTSLKLLQIILKGPFIVVNLWNQFPSWEACCRSIALACLSEFKHCLHNAAVLVFVPR